MSHLHVALVFDSSSTHLIYRRKPVEEARCVPYIDPVLSLTVPLSTSFSSASYPTRIVPLSRWCSLRPVQLFPMFKASSPFILTRCEGVFFFLTSMVIRPKLKISVLAVSFCIYCGILKLVYRDVYLKV